MEDLILRSGVFAASRRMAASPCVASILRDARKGALLRMTAEIASQTLRGAPQERRAAQDDANLLGN